jgi:geranylgeranylglycerol-phosphate geranylgeranyltransferase
MQSIRAFIILLRWQNCLLAAFGAWVGAYTSEYPWLGREILLVALTTFLVTAGGNVSNDIADFKIDSIAKQWRPLPGGMIGMTSAWVLALLFFVSGSMAGALVSPVHRNLALGASVFLLAYNFLFKRIPLLGNCVVAILSGLPFLFGGLLSSAWMWSLIPFLFAVCLHFGREVLKSIQDAEGDVAGGVRTIAAFVPSVVLKRMVLFLFFMVLALSLVPLYLELYGFVYLCILVPGVFLPMIIIGKLLIDKNWMSSFERVHQLLKIEMFAGMIAILFAR